MFFSGNSASLLKCWRKAGVGDLPQLLWGLQYATPQVEEEAGAQNLGVEGESHNLEEEKESQSWADWVFLVEPVEGLPS